MDLYHQKRLKEKNKWQIKMKNKYFEFNLNKNVQDKVDKFLSKPLDKEPTEYEKIRYELRRTKFYFGIGLTLFFIFIILVHI